MARAIPLIGLLLAGAALAATPPRTVLIGTAAPDLDACPSVGTVTGLNPRGDNFLSVRAGPGSDARELGRLRSGHLVHICEETADGRWFGIVYDPRSPGLATDCGVGSPVPQARPYRGRCASGWVSARYVRVVAG